LIILFEGCILDDRQSDGLPVQIQIDGVYAGVSVQRSERADGERHRLGGMGQAGDAPFDDLNCPGRNNSSR
jgi:hypothetical protein